MKLYLIGDVHGDLTPIAYAYNSLDAPIIQLGDLGFNSTWCTAELRYLDKLRVVPGNHDQYPICVESKISLGSYGLLNDNPLFKDLESKVFFIRGADSIDKEYRVQGKSWWPEEELTITEGYSVMDAYEVAKPDIVLSHDCPQSMRIAAFNIHNTSRTSALLESLLHIHRPKVWYHGHHHKDVELDLSGTKFRCLSINRILCVNL